MLRARLATVALSLLVSLAAFPRGAPAASSHFGDDNQTFDPTPGSPDLLSSYPAIPFFKLQQMLNVWPKTAGLRSETDEGQTNLSWQWALWEHGSYAYTDLNNNDLLTAILTIEERVMPEAWATGEDLYIYDEVGGHGPNLGDDVHPQVVSWLQGEGVTDWTYIRLVFDLLSGQADVYALDNSGAVDTSLGTAGLLGSVTIPANERDAILALASDGELWGEVGDDFALSQATLDVTVLPEPATLGLLGFGGLLLLGRRRRR